jgi:hypothetical protein
MFKLLGSYEQKIEALQKAVDRLTDDDSSGAYDQAQILQEELFTYQRVQNDILYVMINESVTERDEFIARAELDRKERMEQEKLKKAAK